MAGNEVRINISASSDDAERSLKRTTKSVADLASAAKRAGLALSAMGAAGAVAFGFMIKSSLEQEIGIRKLDQALKNIGMSYADVREEIEANIEALQRKTNFGDEIQRETLQKLVALSGDYENSLKALSATMDLAAGLGIDLNAATNLVGRGIAGNTELFSRYGVAVEAGASATELLTVLTKQFAGAAEAAANPLIQMKNRLGDVAQEIASGLTPFVERAADAIEKFARIIQNMDSDMLKMIGIVGGLGTAFALAAGPLLLFVGFLPSIIGGFTALAPLATALGVAMMGLAAAAAPVLLLVAALLALEEGIIRLARITPEWVFGPNIREMTTPIEQMTEIFETLKQTITETLGELSTELFGQAMDDANDAIDKAREGFDDYSEGGEQATGVTTTLSRAVRETGNSFHDLIDELFELFGNLDPMLDRMLDLQKLGLTVGESIRVAAFAIRDDLNRQLDEMAEKVRGGADMLARMREAGVSLANQMSVLGTAIENVKKETEIMITTGRGVSAAMLEEANAMVVAGLAADGLTESLLMTEREYQRIADAAKRAEAETQRLLDAWWRMKRAFPSAERLGGQPGGGQLAAFLATAPGTSVEDLNELFKKALQVQGKEAFGLQGGGVVPGAAGTPVPIVAHAGETVTPPGGFVAPSGGGIPNINVYIGQRQLTDIWVEIGDDALGTESFREEQVRSE